MSFESDLRAFALKVETRSRDLFVGSTLEVQKSVVEGSTVTGAPGQPEDEGGLRGSYIPEFTEPWVWRTTTGLPYARSNEDGIARPGGGPYIQRSPVGGRHSIALTRAGWPRIIDTVLKRVVPK